MATLDALLKEHYLTPDEQTVTLTVSTRLGVLREQRDALQALNIQSIDINEGKTARATPAKKKPAARESTKKAAKKASTALPKAKPTPKKTTKASKPSKSAKKSAPRLSQQAILGAIEAGHTTAPAIAAAISGKQRQISNALSRYLSAGLVERVNVGEYALTKAKKS